jgi:hypothetical protein
MSTSNGGFIGVTLDPIFEKVTTFTSSGNFTPQVSTGTDEVEVLVVSGGGGGASRYGGGGGGGGVDTVTALEVAANTAYPVVVGGGGAGGAASGGSGTSGAGDGTNGTTSSFSGTSVTTISTAGGGGGGAGDTRDGLRGGSGGGGAGGGSAGTTDGGSAIAAHAITAFGDVNHATAQSKHGTTSLEFDGTGDWLSLNDTGAFDWGTDDFTIEFWWYVTDHSYHSPFSFGWSSGADGGLASVSHTVYAGNAPGITQYWMFDGSDVFARGDTHGSVMNEWQHWALVCDNGDVELYLDGSVVTGSSVASGIGADPDIGSPNSSRDYFIGCWYSSPHYSYPYEGYLDDFRVSTNARYTTTFTPPTSQLPHDSHTILLIQSNSSDGNTTFTDLSQGTLGREGYIGGNGGNASPYYQGAGGGGAGAAAANSTNANTAANGAGGIGYSNAISGTATYYAGGGGGGDDAAGSKSYAASGGTGGGGAGGGQNGGATTGTANTGGGGGGGGWVSSTNIAGAAGGSGVVIVKETATGNSGIYNMDDVYAYSIDNKW